MLMHRTALYYRQYLLYYGNDPTSSPTVLPMGNYELEHPFATTRATNKSRPWI